MAQLLTVAEFAEQLRVSRGTAARLLRDGTVPSVVVVKGKHRRLVRVPQEAVERYLAQLAIR